MRPVSGFFFIYYYLFPGTKGVFFPDVSSKSVWIPLFLFQIDMNKWHTIYAHLE